MCDDDDVNELLLPLFTTLNKKRSGVFNWKCSEAMAWRAVDNKGVHDFIMFASSATTKKREFHSSRTTARKNLVYSNFPLSIIQKPHRHLSPKKREFGAHEHEADENLRLSVLACPFPLCVLRWLPKVFQRRRSRMERKNPKLYVICDKVCFLLKSRIQFPPGETGKPNAEGNFLVFHLTSPFCPMGG